MSSDWRDERVATIRSVIAGVDPAIEEAVKWRKPSNPDGVPTFSLDGLLCTVETYRDKVKITFAQGASIPDPGGLFNASLTAGTRRAIDIAESDTVDKPALATLIADAISLNRATLGA